MPPDAMLVGALPTARGWATLTVEADGDEYAIVCYRPNRWVLTRREIARPLGDLNHTREYAQALVLLAGGLLGETHRGVLNAPAHAAAQRTEPLAPRPYTPDSAPDRGYLRAMLSDRTARFLIVPNAAAAKR